MEDIPLPFVLLVLSSLYSDREALMDAAHYIPGALIAVGQEMQVCSSFSVRDRSAYRNLFHQCGQ